MAMASTSAAEGSGSGASPKAGGPEIAFFDLETSVPQRPGQSRELLEFGAIIVCPRHLVELSCYATLVRPADTSTVTTRYNGITPDAIANAPPFSEVADSVYNVLHGRIWAGHNIISFDSAIITEAFTGIGRLPPKPRGHFDTFTQLEKHFRTRAGDMKMATLARHFGLGRQKHRSLDDVRLNLEILKCCATVLFMETSLPEVLVEHAAMGSLASGSASPKTPKLEANSSPDQGPALLISRFEEMKLNSIPQDCYSEFLEPDDVSTEFIKISPAPYCHFGSGTCIKYKDSLLQLYCKDLMIQFDANTRLLDNAGCPKLSILVDIPKNLCQVLEFCDSLAKGSHLESGSISEWRPLIKKYDYINHPTIRLNIPSMGRGDAMVCLTEIYQKEPSGKIQKLVLNHVGVPELNSLFVKGNKVDGFISLEIYDYKQNAGIRLVTKELHLH